MRPRWWEAECSGAEEPILLSMLEHYAYCPRQFALIHIEQTYEDNIFTIKGDEGHERVDEPESGESGGVRFERALPLFNREYGFSGKADLVEFPRGIPYPVEYKHGSHSGRRPAELQLCAQAFCLEEMFQTEVPAGAIYSIKSRKRREVEFTPELRLETLEMVIIVRKCLSEMKLPPPVSDKRCQNCSLLDICSPEMMGILADNSLINTVD
jgi:CRISPR-associated exonuclease Cas4